MKRTTAVLAILSAAEIVFRQPSGTSVAAQANDPPASFNALNFQDYVVGELAGPDEAACRFRIRCARPFSVGKANWLLRASLPVNGFPVPPSQETKSVRSYQKERPAVIFL